MLNRWDVRRLRLTIGAIDNLRHLLGFRWLFTYVLACSFVHWLAVIASNKFRPDSDRHPKVDAIELYVKIFALVARLHHT